MRTTRSSRKSECVPAKEEKEYSSSTSSLSTSSLSTSNVNDDENLPNVNDDENLPYEDSELSNIPLCESNEGEESFISSQKCRDGLARRPLKRNESNEEEFDQGTEEEINVITTPESKHRMEKFINSPPNEKYRHSSPAITKGNIMGKTKESSQIQSDKCFMMNNKTYVFIAVIVLLAAFLGYYMNDSTLSNNSRTYQNTASSWNQKLLKLKKDFPSIKDWRAVNVSVSKVYKSNKQPGVLLLMGETEQSANCLAKKLLSFFHNIPQNAKEMVKQHPEPMELKDTLHFSLTKFLDINRAYGLLNIDQLSGKSAMVFHSFCDNENAPYPHSFIVLTLPFPKSIPFIPETAEQVIEDHLTQLWTNNLSLDKASPLINRIIGYTSYVPVESIGPCSSREFVK